jgi:hypothetical protein
MGATAQIVSPTRFCLLSSRLAHHRAENIKLQQISTFCLSQLDHQSNIVLGVIQADAEINSIDNNPDLHFLIVINPNSGPGEPPAPDANYSRELPLFNAKENVTTVGYVRMQYCKRSVEQVFDDVTVYGGWSKDHEATGNGIYVEGIFLDEAPNEWSHDVGKYLNVVSEKIKNTPGILGEKLVSPFVFPV